MPHKDAIVCEAIKSAIGTTRQGRKKVIGMVQRKHPHLSSSRIRRVYQKEGFPLYVKPAKRRANTASNPAYIPMKENQEWAVDFMHDCLENGRQFRALNIIDSQNRVCKGLFLNYSIAAHRLIEFMERAIDLYGKAAAVPSDNGPEFISKRFQLWLKKQNISWEPIKKGSPQENCFIERFNRTAREDLFDACIFSTLDDAQQKADEFRNDYNKNRPHESLQNKTPLEYAA